MAINRTENGALTQAPNESRDDAENGIEIDQPELESSPSSAPADYGGIELSSQESLPIALTKLMVLESFLQLLTWDCHFHDFMREILSSMMKAIQCEAGSILELDEPSGNFIFRSISGQSSDRLDKFTIPKGKGIVGHVAESRLPLAVNQVEENKVHLKVIGKAVGFETRNIACAPILIRGKVYGVVELINRFGVDEFTAADVELLSYLCENASKVIELRMMLNWAQKRNSGSAA